MIKNKKIAALIVAAGNGTRIGGNVPKQYLQIGNEIILEKSIKAFYNNKLIDNVLIVVSKGTEELFQPIFKKFEEIKFCYGGVLRQDSVRIGLNKLKDTDYVLIHDAARPFADDAIIERVVRGFNSHDAVLPAVKVKDTIKKADNNLLQTLDRDTLFAAQTPQGFKYSVIQQLHEKYKGEVFSDDIALAEKAGTEVLLVEGSYANYKITTNEDMMLNKKIKIGSGFDVHQFEEGSEVILCGVKIPFNKKLKGHSDADCAWHALTDAILGAIGLGDIGEHFPDNKSEWKNADSSIFLRFSANEVLKRGGVINNVDITVICEEPKMKNYKGEMKRKTAEILEIDIADINIKATTTEKLGFLGRGEGLAAMANVTIAI